MNNINYLREVLDELPFRKKNKKYNEEWYVCITTKYDSYSIPINHFFDYPEESCVQFDTYPKARSIDYEDIKSIGYNCLPLNF